MTYSPEEIAALFEEAKISQNPYVLGYAHGAQDFATYKEASDILTSFLSLKHKIPISQVWKFAEGYADGGRISKGSKRNQEFALIKQWIKTRQEDDRMRFGNMTSNLEKLANHFYNLTCLSQEERVEEGETEEGESGHQRPHRKLLYRLDLNPDQINPEEVHPDHEMFQPEPAVTEGEEYGDPDWENFGDQILTDEKDRANRLEEREKRPRYNQNGYYDED